MNDAQKRDFENYRQTLQRFGITLQKPHGLRKHFTLDKLLDSGFGGSRYRMGSDWESAKASIPSGLAWLFRTHLAAAIDRQSNVVDGSQEQAET